MDRRRGRPLSRSARSAASSRRPRHADRPIIFRPSIQAPISDGATVPIFYEGRLPELRILGNTLDAVFDRVFADRSDEEREAIKKKYATEVSIAGAPKRVEAVCLDLIEHFTKFIRPNGFKAQIVTVSREIACLYRETRGILAGTHAPRCPANRVDVRADTPRTLWGVSRRTGDENLPREALSRPSLSSLVRRHGACSAFKAQPPLATCDPQGVIMRNSSSLRIVAGSLLSVRWRIGTRSPTPGRSSLYHRAKGSGTYMRIARLLSTLGLLATTSSTGNHTDLGGNISSISRPARRAPAIPDSAPRR